MITLQHALHTSSWRLLKIIGRQRGLRFQSNIRKADLLDRLSPHLLDPDNISLALTALSSQARQALADLLSAGGHLPVRYLARPYGLLRSPAALIRAWPQRDQTATSAETDTPPEFSALEQLCLLGLAFHDPATHDLFIPADLIPHLPAPAVPPPPEPVILPHALAPVDLLCHDLASLLACLQREDLVPLHGRWLPPRFLATWAETCIVNPASPHARSELQTNRRRFLHYLAAAGGWLEWSRGAGARARRREKNQSPPPSRSPSLSLSPSPSLSLSPSLSPSPAAWLWLNGSRTERLQSLWDIWSNPDPALWAAFRLPGTGWLTAPARLLHPIHQALLHLDPADPDRFATWLLKQQPPLQDLVPANLLDPLETLTDTIAQLLRGPLLWLGVLVERGSGGAGERGYTVDVDAQAPGTSGNLQMTLQGRAWLAGQPPPVEEVPAYAKFSILTDLQDDPLASSLTLTLPAGLPEPVDWVVAMAVGSREYGVGGLKKTAPTAYSLLLTSVSFIRALHHGWSPPALRAALEHLAERPLTGPELDLLRTWAEAAGRMTLHQALLLETTDPEIITRLASTRRGRALIHRTLSPRVIVVDPAKQDQLVRRLTQQEGVPPYEQGSRGAGVQGGKEPISSAPPFVVPLPRPSAQHLWLALQVYRGLGHLIRLPVRIPQTVLDQVAAAAGPADLASADIAAEQTLAALRQLIDGRAPFPPWPEEGLPEAESLAIIEAALKSGQGLQMSYYTAGRDELTHRLVEPYRLEWHGRPGTTESGEREADSGERTARSGYPAPPLPAPRSSSGTPYLVGFCHRAQAERMFRLDRIRALVSVPLPDEPGQPWGE